jgi:regulator of RNase E activity RraA
MMHEDRIVEFETLSTPLIADACLRSGVVLRVAPAGIHSIAVGQRFAGRCRPARHSGSVDVFLEAYDESSPGEILVIDNGGRLDEGCIGDLTVLEAKAAKLAGVIVWGAHRDASELMRIGFPVFSYGTNPSGPRKVDPRPADALTRARFGDFDVTGEDYVFADDDGAVFVNQTAVQQVTECALSIQNTERKQAEKIQQGNSLRSQLRWNEYLQERKKDPEYTLRKHLQKIHAAIEV